MNRFAYYMSGYAFKAFSGITRARITVHDKEKIPEGALIFTANHFTRIETVFLPYHIHEITQKPVWSLAAAELFQGSLKGILEAMGAVSTRDPQRDFLIVKGLLSGGAECIIFPEGMMVKNKKTTRDGEFMLYEDGQIQRPHTGAAILALSTEFYRERLKRMQKINPAEFDRLVSLYELKDPDAVLQQQTFIVPVNLTYYPVRAKENMVSKIALGMMENPSRRVIDELLTEGNMLFSGVDVDIRFGDPISIKAYLNDGFVESDLTSRRAIDFSNRLCSHHVMKRSARHIMGRYMTSVYEMTTLNHDHIFASILKYMPQTEAGIDLNDFRCRAYLATYACSMQLYCNFHRSLYENQINLVTDDRFRKFEEFLELAKETGIVDEREGRLFKDSRRFDAPSLFHSVRIDNPVSVIANEVEPLAALQAYLADIAVKDPAEIAQLMVYRIEDRQFREYMDDFNQFACPLVLLEHTIEADRIMVEESGGQGGSQLDDIATESIANEFETTQIDPSESIELFEPFDVMLTSQHRRFLRSHLTVKSRKAVYESGRPRLLKSSPGEDQNNGERDEMGVLLIHDYLSSPGELIPFAAYLQQKGMTVYLPRLPGHGTSPENLSGIRFIQWMEAVEEGGMLLRNLCHKVVVGGMGLGGMLGFLVVSKMECVDGIFMVSPPTRVKDYPSGFYSTGTLWNIMMKRNKHANGEREAFISYPYGADPRAKQIEEESNPAAALSDAPSNYSAHPLSAFKQVELLLAQVETAIKEREKQTEETHPHIVACPMLVIQSGRNRFIDPDGSKKLYDRISAPFKEFFLFDFETHSILNGKGSKRVHAAILGFLETISQNA